jgi:hypothetical protein
LRKSLAIVFFSLLCYSAWAQRAFKGQILDENKQPIPGVGIYVKNSSVGVYSDNNGKFYLELRDGQYDMIVSFIGYKRQEFSLIMNNKDVVKNIFLEVDDAQLDEVIIKAKRRDPAYEIMQNAIDRKHIYLKQYNSLTSEVYIKASEQKALNDTRKNRKKAEEKKEEVQFADFDKQKQANIDDPFKDTLRKYNTNNLVEVFLTRHYEYPNKVKEIRNGYKQIGSKFGLYYLTTADDDFNFYENLLYNDKLSETPIVSPLNTTAILTYKFKLLGSYFDEQQRTIYKIEVIPRGGGNASLSGIIHIYDKTFNIKELDFYLDKGNMINFDEFNIKQVYTQVDSLWIINYQEFNYYTNTKNVDFRGKTIVKYSDFIVNPDFKKRYFNNEVAITTKDAYERDSTYWDSIRPQPLSSDELNYIRIQDSIYQAHNKKEYLDSVDAEFNKITFGKVAYWGVGYRNRAKKYQFDFGAIPQYLQPFWVGGFRAAPYFTFFKRWENGKYINSYQQLSYGLRNKDVKGSISTSYRYNPFKLGTVSVSGGSQFDLVNSFDAYINMIKRSNFIQRDYFDVSHRFEILNGLYSFVRVNFNNRRPITNLQFDDFIDQFVSNNTPLEFEGYQATIANIYLSYVPFQKFMREPNQKVVLGSKWPEFTLRYEKGIPKVFGSDIDFDFVGMSINQSVTLFTFGTLNYNVMGGQFLNTKDLRYIDYKIFRQSDPWLYSNPLYSFQLLDTSLNTTGLYTEAHFIHHFNGALGSNVPLFKKTRIKSVVGGGVLWVQNNNFFHQELFLGIERDFRIYRQRFRIGAYYVVSESNQMPFNTGFKFSIEFFNNRENKWNF